MEYSEDLRIGMVLCGGTAYCYTQEELDELVSQLQQCCGHKGVIITGYSPWTVTVLQYLLPASYVLSNKGINKYFKCVRGKFAGQVFFRELRYITMLTSDGDDDFSIDGCEFVEVKPVWVDV